MPTLEIRVIAPKKLYNPVRAQTAIENAYQEVARGAQSDFQRTTSSWRHSVSFSVVKVGTSWYVTTGSKLYEMISETGAKPHKIVARRSTYLRFAVGYTAKTSPGSLSSGGGGKSGRIVMARTVYHPGFRARKFVTSVMRKWEPILMSRVNAAVAKEA